MQDDGGAARDAERRGVGSGSMRSMAVEMSCDLLRNCHTVQSRCAKHEDTMLTA